MPSSDPAAREALVNYVKGIGIPDVILDLGVGAGGYGTMFKQIAPNCKIYGVEIWAPYLTTFKQNLACYEDIYIGDIRYFDYKYAIADLVIAGDVLEHLQKSDCIRVVDRLVSIYNWIIISLPMQKFEQGSNNKWGNKYEAHLYHWTKEEVERELGFKFVTMAGVCGLFEYRNK